MDLSDSYVRNEVPQAPYRAMNDQAAYVLQEWMALGRVLTKSPKNIQTQFCLCLQILGLTLLERYDGTMAKALLRLGESEIISILSEDGEAEYETLASLDQDDISLAFHCIALMRILLEEAGGEEARMQREYYDSTYSATQNQVIYGAAVGVHGPCSVQKTDATALHDALAQSKRWEQTGS
ncbi:hypothetical protein NOF04DRAFT_1374252 [Fusarium oxysporum II5]|uniref:Uncharacterized protein n=1 Tax=Fusarium oxysporum f. sp. cubense TaxID=61366 RepID=A0A559LJK6_FUSOC|nr:hypothetical protein NOF04DRAFT_1374252 [Fusarium oxysporum II5]TVY74439.1 hypothetical protein Focb16_v006088 [Fusarium oxysporum f. sp. cubense]